MYGYEPPVTDASKANKQYSRNVWLQYAFSGKKILLLFMCSIFYSGIVKACFLQNPEMSLSSFLK
jgi:hypothetical protein